MEDADPETQALLIKLHRELNQLPTRAARRKTVQPPPAPNKPSQNKDASKQKQRQNSRSPTPASTEGSPEAKTKDEDNNRKKQHEGTADPITQERPSKRLKPSKPARSLTPAESDQPSPLAKQGAADKQGAAADTDGSNATHHEAPISAVAAAACDAVKHKLRQQASQHASGASKQQQQQQRQVKCFHAGVRWGVSLPAGSIQSRADLAAALNDAFAGHILSCGRGDLLEIVMLEGAGAVTEFSSLRSGIGRESSQRWKACIDKAAKVYVRPDRQPSALL